MEEFLQNWSYVGLAVILMLTGMGLPVPEDIPLLASGIICGEGHANIYIMIPVAVFFTVFSDCILYFLGRKYGHHIPKLPMLKKYLTEKNLAKAEKAFNKHGGKTLFMSRFMPGIRATFYLSAGMFRVPFWKMIVFDGGAAILSVPCWILVAYYFAKHDMLDRLEEVTGGMKTAILVLVGVVIGGFLLWHFVIRPRMQKRKAAASAMAKEDGADDHREIVDVGGARSASHQPATDGAVEPSSDALPDATGDASDPKPTE